MRGLNHLIEETFGFRLRYPPEGIQIEGDDLDSLVALLVRAGCCVDRQISYAETNTLNPYLPYFPS